MDTKLAKNYTIIFLLVLNIVLFTISFFLEEKYKITKEQEQNIISYLEQENVKIYTKIPKKYSPMPKITMKKTKYDNLLLQNIFFDDSKNITRTERFEDTIFKQDNKTLTVNNLFIYFSDLDKKEGFSYSKENCIKFAERYKKGIEDIYGKMILDRSKDENEYYFISYIQKIDGYKIFNNTLNIKVYKDGQLELYFNNYSKKNVVSKKLNICSPDEAIYTFVKEIKNLIPNKEIYIRQIDLGYYLKINDENINLSFEPYYRFYIKDNETPFYVNSYTNTFEYENIIFNTEEIF